MTFVTFRPAGGPAGRKSAIAEFFRPDMRCLSRGDFRAGAKGIGKFPILEPSGAHCSGNHGDMAKTLGSDRIQSVDVLRGLVMVIMALDHVRDYFHLGADSQNPLDPDTTSPILFFTRFITHYCAPVFIFLAGTSASFYGRNKPLGTLSRFLWTRGVWLIFVEIVIMSLLWWSNPRFEIINLQVIWVIGLCMIFMAGIIYLPFRAIVALGLIMVFGHNALDGITAEGQGPGAILWYILHQDSLQWFGDRIVMFHYPIIPWIGVMALGYTFGRLYDKGVEASRRKTWLLRMGFGALALFALVRGLNVYGDLVPWSVQARGPVYTFLSFMNVHKYPPSLLYLLITLGPAMLFLHGIESVQNRFTKWMVVFGRVPFFYYVIHVFVIHLAAIIGLLLTGGDWTIMILGTEFFTQGSLNGYGYPLYITYLVWIGVVVVLYFPSRAYMRYKLSNKDKAWLSYL